MTRETKIGFIGAGHIAEALIRGIITSGYRDPGQVVISDLHQKRLIEVHETLGPTVAWSNEDNVRQCSIVFVAVKPFQVEQVVGEVKGALTEEHFLISVAAGTSLSRIRGAVGDRPRLCRLMPNLAANVRRSTMGLYADEALSDNDLAPVYELLSNLGRVFRIEREEQMAVVTALSGSAPAYYVMMADALIRYGVSQGIPEELATSMILSTMQGSASWAMGARMPLEQLWKRVVTPGGTTEAGIRHYEEKGFLDIFVEGLVRSTKRARELGDD